ncbi:MAG: PAS domain S-box protein [Actinobacteria bacterium]|jgi:PAS domain S-box-containing protein|nr:MAG: PAS domain S-box protein [Actinomycetota bacterium]
MREDEELRENRERLEELVEERTRALRESELSLRRITDNMVDMVGQSDVEGIFTYISPSCERILGYKPEEMVGRSVFEFIHPDDVQGVVEAFAAARETLRPDAVEYRYRHADGHYVWLETIGNPLFDEAGELIGGIFTTRDVTGRRSAEEALRESEERFRQIAENAVEWIWEVDPDGLYTFSSPGSEKLLGYRPEEIVGKKHFYDFFAPDMREELRAAALAAFAARASFGGFLNPNLHKNGSIVILETNGSPIIDTKGEFAGYRGADIDVTGRERAERELRYRLELEELVSTISTHFVKLPPAEIDDAVYRALQDVGAFAGVDRSYVFRFSADGATMDNTHEWCAEGIEPQIDSLQGLPVDIFPWWVGRLRVFETIYIPRIADLSPEAGAEKEILQAQGIQSLVVVPLVYGNSLYGFMGFDSVREEKRWAEEDIALLKTVGEILVNALERKRAEEELIRMSNAVRMSSDSIVVTDMGGRIVDVNDATLRMYGARNKEDLLGRSSFDLIAPEDREDALLGMMETARTGYLKNREVRILTASGSRMPVEINVSIMKEEEGNPTGFVAVTRDITERKLMREKLEKINRLFLSLGPDLMENIERAMQATKDVLGGEMVVYSRLDKGKLSILSTASGEEAFRVTDISEDHVSSALLSGDLHTPLVLDNLGETRFARTCPEIARYGFISFLGYPVEREGQVIGCLGLYDSVKREYSNDDLDTLGVLARAISIEEERLAHEEDLKDFLDIASHELRHPITLMKGYAITLRDMWGRLNDDVREEMLNGIDRGADRMDGLLRELLEVSRIERGRFELDRREVPIVPIIERAVYEMSQKGLENRVNLTMFEDVGIRRVDPERLIELLIILLDNANKYSPPGSEIDIEAGMSDEGLTIAVTDRGQGIPQRDRERIFERFYQVEDALHHSKPGMGIGLYIAREIVEAHGGRIWHEHREDGGSIFRFTIP